MQLIYIGNSLLDCKTNTFCNIKNTQLITYKEDKIVLNNNLYSFTNNTIGTLLAENIFENSSVTFDSLTENLYVSDSGKLYTFNDNNNEFILYGTLKGSNVVFRNNCVQYDGTNGHKKLLYSTNDGSIFGYKVNGINYYSDSGETLSNSDILVGKKAYSQNGNSIVGTMPNNGALNITPSTSSQTIPAGYTSGGTVSAVTNSIDSNIQAENIKSGVSILGVDGSLEAVNNQDKTITTNGEVTADDGYTGLGTVTVNVDSIPDGIFIQEETPTKTTDEALWLKESNSGDAYFKTFPDTIMDYRAKNDMSTVREVLDMLTQKQKKALFSRDYFLIHYYTGSSVNHFITITGTNTLRNWGSMNPMNHLAGDIYIYRELKSSNISYVEYTSSSGYGDWGRDAEWKYNFDMMDGSSVYQQKDFDMVNISGSDVMQINVNDKVYSLYLSKLASDTNFSGILDTSNADATANDIVSGKTAFVNNTKITGTFAGVDSSDATATSVDICAGKTAYINNVKVTGTGPMTFATETEMNQVTNVPENTLAIVYGTNYVGTYRFDNGSWTQIGDASVEQEVMDNLNTIMGSSDEYEGLGGTEEEVNEVFDEILGNEGE